MLIIIPVSFSDENLIEDFCNCFNHFGPYLNHHLLVVSRPSDSSHAIKVLNKVKKNFKTYDVHIFENDGKKGWPDGPNFYWHQTIKYLKYSIGNNLPWLWMELDMTPLKIGWIDILENEYYKHGKSCLGWVEDTSTITTDGIIVKLASHLVGAAIYPADIDICCNIWKYVDRISTAFDVLCQDELVPNSHHTNLFQHGFRTQNYKEIAPNFIKGEHIDSSLPEGLRFDEPICASSVIHHGCDDGSLARLLITRPIKKFAKIEDFISVD